MKYRELDENFNRNKKGIMIYKNGLIYNGNGKIINKMEQDIYI